MVVRSGIHIGEVGRVASWDSILEQWEIDFGGFSAYKQTEEVEPMFTMDQIIGVKLQEQQSGSDIMDKVKGFGLTTEELADYCKMFIVDCTNRIKGVGDQQYSNPGYQKFEVMELDDLLEGIEEEIRDIPNYLTMLFIRIRRIREALKTADIIEDKEEIPRD